VLNDYLSVALNPDGTLKQGALIAGAQQTAEKAQANGYASLDTNGRVPTAQLPLTLPPVTLTDAATVATNASLGNHFRVTLGGNRTLGNPTNPTDGQKVVWEFIQDATGTRTITLGANFALGTDISAVTLSTGPGQHDFMGAVYNAIASKWYVIAFVRGY
jgi:hypothetical protein